MQPLTVLDINAAPDEFKKLWAELSPQVRTLGSARKSTDAALGALAMWRRMAPRIEKAERGLNFLHATIAR